MGAPKDTQEEHSIAHWYLRGVAGVVSIPAFILMAAFIGYAGLARDSGLTLGEAVVTTATIWALPNQVVMVGALASGTSIVTAALAVTLTAVRLMPMVVVWVPVIRDETTPKWQIYALSHFVAVTSWVFAMSRLPDIPRKARVPYFAGFATTLSLINISITAIAFQMVGRLPEMLAGALFFLTPIYFLVSLWAAAQSPVDKIAMVVGLILGPLLFLVAPEFDLLLSGLIGGTAAYLIGRFRQGGAP